ncbi:hypothetical protein [Thermococcus peptonophilus]
MKMKKHLFKALFTFFEDMLLIYFLGAIAGVVIYPLISLLAWTRGGTP